MALSKTKMENERKLRTLQWRAFERMVDAFRAEGALTEDKKKVLNIVAKHFRIDEERGKSEFRRAVNDDSLTSIADSINGRKTDHSWRIESTRRIPFLQMVPSRSPYTSLANNVARVVSEFNEELAKSSNPYPSLEEIKTANVQKNIEEISEREMLNSFHEKIDYNDEAISEEIEMIENIAHNQFTNPEEYRSVMSHLEQNSEVYIEPRVPREDEGQMLPPSSGESIEQHENVSSSPVLVNELIKPHENPLVKKSTIEESSTIRTNAASKVEISFEETVKVGLSTKVIYKQSTNKPPKRSRNREKLTPPLAIEEPVRMQRKAKLNAKRWNPKTQTLESPLINASNDSNSAESAVLKAKSSRPSNKKSKDGVLPKAERVIGDTRKRKRERRSSRKPFNKRRRVKNSNKVESIAKTGDRVQVVTEYVNHIKSKANGNSRIAPVDSSVNNLIIRKVSDSKKSSSKTDTAVKRCENTPFGAAKPSSQAPKIISRPRSSLSESDVHSTPVRIIRKKIFIGGSRIQQTKNIGQQSTSSEVPTRIPIEYPNSDPESRTKMTSSVAEIVQKMRTVVSSSRETTSSETVKPISSIISIDNLPNETQTNCGHVINVEELAVATNTQKEPIVECIPSTPVTEVVPNPSEVINCDTASESRNSASSSTITIVVVEDAGLKTSATKIEQKVPSVQNGKVVLMKSSLKRKRTLTPGCGEKPSSSQVARIVQNGPGCGEKPSSSQVASIVQNGIAESPQNAKRIKTLTPGCGKNVSQLLLGSKVRVRKALVRNRESLTPDSANSQMDPAIKQENDANADENRTSPIELKSAACPVGENLLEKESEVNGGNNEELRSDINSGSEESSDPKNRIESDESLGSSSSFTQSSEPEEDESSGATKAAEDVLNNTITIINEDWKDDESYHEDEKVLVEKSTLASTKLIVDGALSTMIGVPQWAPKVIKANRSVFCHVLSKESLRTYVHEK